MAKKAVTIYDLAQALSLSPATVSRALNEDPKINVNTRKRVKAAAREFNYQPNSLAAGLRSGSSRNIGVVVPRIHRQFFANVISGIESVAREKGYHLMITQSGETHSQEAENVTALTNARIDGLLISLSVETDNTDYLKHHIERGLPVVCFDRVDPKLSANRVIVDDFGGAKEAVDHLLARGCRRIAHLGGPDHVNVYAERYRGYLTALREANIEEDPRLVFRDHLTEATGSAAAEVLMSLDNPPDAIFAASDYSALGIVQYCRENNVQIPEDLAIVGFANEPFTALMEPSLTSVEQFSVEMGEKAAHLIFEQLTAGKKVKPFREIKIKPQLIIRDSSR